MKAKDFRQEQDYPYNHFTKLTSTGISPDYDNIEEFAEKYHQEKVKTLRLFSVVGRSEQLKCDCCSYEYSELIIKANGRKLCKDCA